jgi:hypothetical protein
MQRIVELNDITKRGINENSIVPVCDGIEKYVKFDMTVNRETVSEFSRFFLRFLDRVFGEDTTGCVVDTSTWVRGDKGGWLRIASNRRIYSVGSVTAGSHTLVAAEDELLRLLAPSSPLFSSFVLEYRQREYELDSTLLPESVRAALTGSPLGMCVATFGAEFLEAWFRSRGAKQTRSSRAPAEAPTALLLEPYEYFLVCMLRHPVAAPDANVAASALTMFQGRSSGRVAEDMVRGSNFLRLFQRYLTHYIPDADALTTAGSLYPKTTPRKAAASPVLRRTANATRSPHAASPNPASMGGTSGASRNLELFLSLCGCELMQRAVVARRSFGLVTQNFPHRAHLFQYDEWGNPLHPPPLTVVVLNADAEAAAGAVNGTPPWCPSVDCLQATYLLVKRALTCGRETTTDLAAHFERASSGAMKQYLEQLCNQQRGGYAAMQGSNGRVVGAVASLWNDKDKGDARFVGAAASWCGTVALQRLQQPLYDMLRSIFFHCNAVPHAILCHAVELWLMVVQPWKHCADNAGGSMFTEVWRPYVVANFHFYSTLLCILLQSLSGSTGLGRQLNYSVKDADSLRLINYVDSALDQLFGGSAGGSLLDLLDSCGLGLRDLLRSCAGLAGASAGASSYPSSPNVSINASTVAGDDQSMSPVETFVMASHHRLLYPDPTVLTDLGDCGVIVSISESCTGFVNKFYEILASLRVAYSVSASTNAQGRAGDHWFENFMRSLVGVGPVDTEAAKTTALDKNSQRLDTIARNIASRLRYCDKDPGSYAQYETVCEAAAAPSRATQSTDSAVSFARRQRVVDLHLPASYFDNDVDRDVTGRLTAAGRAQLLGGQRGCVKALVRAAGDGLDLPLGLYEVRWLARLLVSWSKSLNAKYNLPREKAYALVSWEDCYYYLFFYHSPANSRSARGLPWLDRWLQIPTAVSDGFRFNLRWMGNLRVAIAGAVVMAMVSSWLTALALWWTVWGTESLLNVRVGEGFDAMDAAGAVAMASLVLMSASLGGLFYEGRFDSVYAR